MSRLICIPSSIDGNSGICLIRRVLAFGKNHLTESLDFMQEIPIKNPVYLMLGASFGSAAKGTGLKALEFALSLCESVDMYGFTVDPGYKEWYDFFFFSFLCAGRISK